MAVPRKLDGTRWHTEDANRLLFEIDRRVKEELHARDVARGLPPSGVVRELIRDPHTGDPVRYVVNEHLAKIKHSGQDTNRERQRRWDEILSQPRDPNTTLAEFGLGLSADPGVCNPPLNERTMAEAMASAIERGIAAGLAAIEGKKSKKKENKHGST